MVADWAWATTTAFPPITIAAVMKALPPTYSTGGGLPARETLLATTAGQPARKSSRSDWHGDITQTVARVSRGVVEQYSTTVWRRCGGSGWFVKGCWDWSHPEQATVEPGGLQDVPVHVERAARHRPSSYDGSAGDRDCATPERDVPRPYIVEGLHQPGWARGRVVKACSPQCCGSTPPINSPMASQTAKEGAGGVKAKSEDNHGKLVCQACHG